MDDDQQDKAWRKKKDRDRLRIKDQSTGASFIVVEEDDIQGISTLFCLLFVDV